MKNCRKIINELLSSKMLITKKLVDRLFFFFDLREKELHFFGLKITFFTLKKKIGQDLNYFSNII